MKKILIFRSVLLRNEDKQPWIFTGNPEPDKVYDGTVYVTYRILTGIAVEHGHSKNQRNPIDYGKEEK